MNSIPPGRRPHDVHGITYPLGFCRNLASNLNNSRGKRIDEWVLFIAFVKVYLTPNRRDTKGVTVVSNALHHSFNQPLCGRS